MEVLGRSDDRVQVFGIVFGCEVIVSREFREWVSKATTDNLCINICHLTRAINSFAPCLDSWLFDKWVINTQACTLWPALYKYL